ncbi:MAG: ABC transporter ATP-binding protein [Balneolaceae bacterium]
MVTLTVQQLDKRYGKHTVLNRVKFNSTLPVVGIAGRNGAGKSTLMRCITGLLKPDRGRVEWIMNGTAKTPDEVLNNHRLGFAAPYIELYEGLTGLENLRFLLRLQRKEKEWRESEMHSHLTLFDANLFSERPYGELSTGQRQRIRLAAACLNDPDILCLDEPGSNLDQEGEKLVVRTIERYRTGGRLVILASNSREELQLCDEILDLDLPISIESPDKPT